MSVEDEGVRGRLGEMFFEKLTEAFGDRIADEFLPATR
jgi:hypothetical protein